MVTNLNAVKIVDFGSAQSFNPLSLKHKDPGDGTLEYMGEDEGRLRVRLRVTTSKQTPLLMSSVHL